MNGTGDDDADTLDDEARSTASRNSLFAGIGVVDSRRSARCGARSSSRPMPSIDEVPTSPLRCRPDRFGQVDHRLTDVGDARGVNPIDFGQRRDAVGHAEQFAGSRGVRGSAASAPSSAATTNERVLMRRHARDHVVNETVVAGHVDEADALAVDRRCRQNPRSIVRPRRCSSARLSVLMPVSASTRLVLP